MRSSTLKRGTVCSTLALFEYAGKIYSDNQARFIDILHACPQLVALSLGCRKGTNSDSCSRLSQKLLAAIVNLHKLERLHLFNCLSVTWKDPIKGFLGSFQNTLTARDRAQGWMV